MAGGISVSSSYYIAYLYPERTFVELHLPSYVSISRPYAYKIKKEITFGEILDFSTLQLRKKIYQKDKAVIKILQEKYNHKIKIAGLDDRGHILEYAIKMRELPQQYRMDNLVMSGKVSLETIKRLTNSLVKFHCTTRTNTQIKNFGKPKFVKMKIVENFKTLTKLATIDPNSIFDVDNNEDGLYNGVHRYDNIGSSVLQCTLYVDIDNDIS